MNAIEPAAGARADRERFWQFCEQSLDVLVIGGGITGAGILHALARAGYRCALIEQADFAWGSSSRSSKLVHGGLRYLKQGRFGLTRSALQARNALLRDYPDLVVPRRFHLPFEKRPPLSQQLGLGLYDLLAGHHSRQQETAEQWRQHFPSLQGRHRSGSLSYLDAATDDCQLVLQELRLAYAHGAMHCNYVRASALLEQRDRVVGVEAHDQCDQRDRQITARLIINATGAWSGLQPRQHAAPAMRPLRGSHLILPFHRLPLSSAVAGLHPVDQRPVYAVPWAGAILFGTTDVDHDRDLRQEPRISASEYDYLMSALSRLFPEHPISESDLLSSCAGVRPTFADGASSPSDTSREQRLTEYNGWLGICGGKLTTYRLMAARILLCAKRQLGPAREAPTMRLPPTSIADQSTWSPHYLGSSDCSEQAWQRALHQQAVVHLDDLLLRRTRLGYTCPDGGTAIVNAKQRAIQSALGWSDQRWQWELNRYQEIRRRYYAPDAFRARETGHVPG